MTSAYGTSRTSRDVRLMSAIEGISGVKYSLQASRLSTLNGQLMLPAKRLGECLDSDDAGPTAARYARDTCKLAACSIAHSSERRTDSSAC